MNSAGIFRRVVSTLCIGDVRLVRSFEGFCTWNHNWAYRVPGHPNGEIGFNEDPPSSTDVTMGFVGLM